MVLPLGSQRRHRLWRSGQRLALATGLALTGVAPGAPADPGPYPMPCPAHQRQAGRVHSAREGGRSVGLSKRPLTTPSRPGLPEELGLPCRVQQTAG